MKTESWYVVKDLLNGKEKRINKRLWGAMKGKLHNDRPRYELVSEPTEVTIAEKKKKVEPEKVAAKPVADNPTNQEVAKRLEGVRSISGLDSFCKWLGPECQNWSKEIEAKESEIKAKIKEGGEQ